MCARGGVIEDIPELINATKEMVRKRAAELALEDITITKAVLGGNAGVIGGATFAQSEINKIL